MIDKLLFEYKRKNKSKHKIKTKSHSLSKKNKIKNKDNLSSEKSKYKPINKNLHKRNILFNNKQSKINLKSTSTSSLSSSAEKKYITPTKYNLQNYDDNDYYYNENYNKTQELFNIANISRPKLDYNTGNKKHKNILLTIGTRINTVNNINNNNNNYFYEKSKILNIKKTEVNRSFKSSKNKYVICMKNNISNNISKFNESKSVESYHHKKNNESDENIDNKYFNIKNYINNTNYNYSECKDNFILNEENIYTNEVKINNIENFNKKRKYKNIVLRPYKIQKENQIKNNIKVNKYEIDDSPKIINKIMTRLNIKPKNSRVFKYK